MSDVGLKIAIRLCSAVYFCFCAYNVPASIAFPCEIQRSRTETGEYFDKICEKAELILWINLLVWMCVSEAILTKSSAIWSSSATATRVINIPNV